jgi:hypothetical protein
MNTYISLPRIRRVEKEADKAPHFMDSPFGEWRRGFKYNHSLQWTVPQLKCLSTVTQYSIAADMAPSRYSLYF